jgi:ADP-dependent NAD(P)H-hydrate dehydratase / NAD(P)H-hydrate epimerase
MIYNYQTLVVNSNQMRSIEADIFASGMPVAALMEKAALLTAKQIQKCYSLAHFSKIGVIVGPGHNGGDALVISRELHLAGYQISLFCPIAQLKDLTAQHANYVKHLGLIFQENLESLGNCQLIIDGLFGFGLERTLSGEIAELVDKINSWQKSVISIDIPSGIHTNTGEVLGTAIKATHTLCLGLWKRAFFQDAALPYLGVVELIDIGITNIDLTAILQDSSPILRVNPELIRPYLPLPRPLLTHKYQQGHLLIICGSRRYAGGAILTGLGARGSGVGMLSIAVPASLKPLVVSHLPEALIIDCPETATGVMAELPLELNNYHALACGPGLTTENPAIIEQVLDSHKPIILDADALNILAELGIDRLLSRKNPTILTPHWGEFKRLFSNLADQKDRLVITQEASRQSGAIVLLKGARTVIASPEGEMWLIPESTSALARGGSGDVLTGLIGGLLTQMLDNPLEATAAAAYFHAQAAILAARERTELGVDGMTLANYLFSALKSYCRARESQN